MKWLWSILLTLVSVVVLIQLLPRPADRPALPQNDAHMAPVSDQPVADSDVESVPTEPAGEPAELLQDGRWTKVLVVDRRENELRVHYPQRTTEWDEWVPAGDVRFPQLDEDLGNHPLSGRACHSGRWMRCQVLKRNGELSYIHYVGESEYFDEWVSASRLRLDEGL